MCCFVADCVFICLKSTCIFCFVGGRCFFLWLGDVRLVRIRATVHSLSGATSNVTGGCLRKSVIRWWGSCGQIYDRESDVMLLLCRWRRRPFLIMHMTDSLSIPSGGKQSRKLTQDGPAGRAHAPASLAPSHMFLAHPFGRP